MLCRGGRRVAMANAEQIFRAFKSSSLAYAVHCLKVLNPLVI